MNKSTNKLRILTKENSVYQSLFEQAALPNLILTNNNTEANIVLAAPAMAAECLDEFNNLSWVQSIYAGVEPLTTPHLRRDYQLTNVKGIFGQQIAEYVLGYAIDHFRHLSLYQAQQIQKQWQPHRYTTLADKQLLVIGAGSIGNHLAKTAATFKLHTVGVNSSGITPTGSEFDKIIGSKQLNAYLAKADIIVSVLPNTPQTEGIFNSKFFSQCDGALFFNVGRGNSVHSAALLQALQQGNIEHAYLDVFVNEPISPQCPYWHNPKITVTPHIAAYGFPEDAFEIFKQNYFNWYNGTALKNCISFDKGY